MACVSLAWFETATDLLWRHATLEHLASHVDESRQQLYASKLTFLLKEGGENALLFRRFEHLQFARLRMAHFHGRHTIVDMNKVDAEKGQLLPCLGAFTGAVPARGVASLMGRMPNLTQLHLILSDAEVPCLCHISTLMCLESLTLRFPRNAELPRAEILSLCPLSNLSKLSIDVCEAVSDAYEVLLEEELDFTDGHFEELVSGFPKLQILHLACECTLTARSMLHLAKCCRRLRSCTLKLAGIDITKLHLDTRSDIAFPNVSSLCWGSLRASGHILGTSQEWSKTLQKHFPRLTNLHFERDSADFCPDVMMAFSEVIDANRCKAEVDQTKFIHAWLTEVVRCTGTGPMSN